MTTQPAVRRIASSSSSTLSTSPRVPSVSAPVTRRAAKASFSKHRSKKRTFSRPRQYIRVSASGGALTRNYSISFTEPYFLGYRLAAGFDLFKSSSSIMKTTPTQTRASRSGWRRRSPTISRRRSGIITRNCVTPRTAIIACRSPIVASSMVRPGCSRRFPTRSPTTPRHDHAAA